MNQFRRKMLTVFMFAALSPFFIPRFIFRNIFYASHASHMQTIKKTNKHKKPFFSTHFQDCPESELDFRSQQCAHFDSVPFEGIRYSWVPYTKAPNSCELNCMPKGERFYYRHKAKVIDGTPYNDETLDVCVNGERQVILGTFSLVQQNQSNISISM